MQYFFLFKTLVGIISPAGGKLRTAGFYGREIPLVVCKGRMAFQRAAWLRNRQAFLSLCRDRTNNYDLQLIYNFYEFLVPLFLDLLRIIQLAPPSVYERALPMFIKGLSMLGMDYTDAYYLHLNTLIYLHKNLRNVYDALLRNANRALVTTDIEFMHRLLAGMTSNQAIRGWEGFNAIIGELPEFETAEEF